jgi:hypothetical protein
MNRRRFTLVEARYLGGDAARPGWRADERADQQQPQTLSDPLARCAPNRRRTAVADDRRPDVAEGGILAEPQRDGLEALGVGAFAHKPDLGGVAAVAREDRNRLVRLPASRNVALDRGHRKHSDVTVPPFVNAKRAAKGRAVLAADAGGCVLGRRDERCPPP